MRVRTTKFRRYIYSTRLLCCFLPANSRWVPIAHYKWDQVHLKCHANRDRWDVILCPSRPKNNFCFVFNFMKGFWILKCQCGSILSGGARGKNSYTNSHDNFVKNSFALFYHAYRKYTVLWGRLLNANVYRMKMFILQNNLDNLVRGQAKIKELQGLEYSW